MGSQSITCDTARCTNITRTVAPIALDRNFVNFSAIEVCDAFGYCREPTELVWDTKLVERLVTMIDEL